MSDFFQIDGLDDLVKDLQNFGTEARPAVRPYVDETTEMVLESVKGEVPEKSGALKKSLHSVRSRSKKRIESYITWGPEVRDYAAPLELGHSIKNMPNGPTLGEVAPHPYMRPGTDKVADKAYKHLAEGISEAVKLLGDI